MPATVDAKNITEIHRYYLNCLTQIIKKWSNGNGSTPLPLKLDIRAVTLSHYICAS